VTAGEQVNKVVNSQVAAQLDEVEMIKSEDAKKAQAVEESYQFALVAMESFQAYSRELLDKCSLSDITRAASELHKTATELLDNGVTSVQYCPPHVTFTPADVTQVKQLNFIRQVTLEDETQPGQRLPPVSLRDETEREKELVQQLNKMKREFNDFKEHSTPLWEEEMKQRDMGRLLHTLPDGEPVGGVTSLDNLLYVLRFGKLPEQIEVYDKDSYRLQRCITVPGLGVGIDIISCAHNRCAYVADFTNSCMHRVGLPHGAYVTKWPVNDKPFCTSVADTHSVLVMCHKVHKIKEFSTHGKLLHQIQLPEDVVSPVHTIQLSSGEFIVSHGDVSDPVHRVCLIASNGHVVMLHRRRAAILLCACSC